VNEYINAHWRGELSLARSYWVNVALLNLLLWISLTQLIPSINNSDHITLLFSMIAIHFSMSIIFIWQVCGTWRSASKYVNKKNGVMWAYVAKLMMILLASQSILGVIKGVGQISDVANIAMR
jgi:hypothetical protein